MARDTSTDLNGQPYDEKTLGAIWRKADLVEMMHPDIWRYDACGSLMKFSEFRNTASEYGWEVDHIKPVAAGGTDDLANLQPLHWETNRRKGDAYPWECDNEPWAQSRF
jgi:5-methylcytosine-specific restriction endonuclease McrA